MAYKLARVSLAAFLAIGCVGGSDEVTEQDRQKLKAYILSHPPSKINHVSNIDFDGKVKLLGYKVEPAGTARPGRTVKLTMYWRCLKKLDGGWNLFTHVLDGSGERLVNIDNVGPLRQWRGSRQIMGPSAWEVGKVYVDEQSFTVPANVKTSKIQVVTGVWKGNQRLAVISGPHDSQNRGKVTTLNTGTGVHRKATPRNLLPSLVVPKLKKDQKIVIDGKIDEEAWKLAARTGSFKDVQTGTPNKAFPVNGSAKLLWDDKWMYIAFDVRDPDVVGGFEKGAKDPHLWTKDAVEIMVDPDGDGDNKDYYEIQINPQNLVFDSRFDSYNQPKKEPSGPFGHQDWSAKLESAVVVHGTLDQAGDRDVGYVVEARIPWKSFAKSRSAPPKEGDRWRMNFYAMQNNGGVAWSPILKQGNFHKASRFGRVTWVVAPKKGVVPGGAAMIRRGPLKIKPNNLKLEPR